MLLAVSKEGYVYYIEEGFWEERRVLVSVPVEFTQGYYYDAVTLQQMVSLPDNPNKTAVINDSNTDVGEISDGHSGVERPRPEPLEVIKNAALSHFCLPLSQQRLSLPKFSVHFLPLTADTSIAKRRPKKR